MAEEVADRLIRRTRRLQVFIENSALMIAMMRRWLMPSILIRFKMRKSKWKLT